MFFLKSILSSIVVLLLVFSNSCNEKQSADMIKEQKNNTSLALTTSLDKDAESVKEMLKPHCGKCHQSTLPSSLKGAIAVFDLDAQENWYTQMTHDQVEQIPSRMAGKVDEIEKQTIARFVDSIAD